MEKEELSISTAKVEIRYEFKNQTTNDIITEVAFPIPDYKWSLLGRSVTDFSDFTVEIDGQRNSYQQEVKAFARGKDCTTILTDMKISIVDFGKYESGLDSTGRRHQTFVDRLSAINKQKLIELGVLKPFLGTEPDIVFPDWSVSIKYYWTQRFPAGKTTIIKHSYGPYAGFRPFCASDGEDIGFLRKNACINESFVSWMRRNGRADDDGCPMGVWVSYILTTANNWGGPIKDFHLNIEKKPDEEISTCFDPTPQKTGDNHYEIQIAGFVPKRDLRIFFFSRKGEVSR